ncbi:hypothetical protein J6590_013910 [Homalodisca vitripennis]|nr:hypothetical protein J6590_013910 [Homalodisca vitripennis]
MFNSPVGGSPLRIDDATSRALAFRPRLRHFGDIRIRMAVELEQNFLMLVTSDVLRCNTARMNRRKEGRKSGTVVQRRVAAVSYTCRTLHK